MKPWLVVEGWIKPSLFAGIPIFLEVGIYFNIPSSASTDACSYLIIQSFPPRMAVHKKRVHKGINKAKRIKMLKSNSITKNPAIIRKDFHDGSLKHTTPPSDLCVFLLLLQQ
jgi:hypothetical protein